MIRSTLTALAAIVALAAPGPAHAQEENAGMEAGTEAARPEARSGYVEINGIDYYYEIHGEGAPLLIIHGGLGLFDMFDPVLPILAEDRQVIGVDLHGHGRTVLGDRPISLEATADDMAALLQEFGYDQVDVLGYSMGGGVAFRIAVQHPETVRRLAMVSAPFARDGFYPEILEAMDKLGPSMADAMKDTPMYKSYAAVAPRVDEFPKLLGAMGQMMAKPYDWSAEVRQLKTPVMLVYGDGDIVRPEHIVEFYQLLGGGLKDAGWMRENMPKNRLAVLPDLTHYEIFAAPEMVEAVLPFLNGESGAKSWAEQMGNAR